MPFPVIPRTQNCSQNWTNYLSTKLFLLPVFPILQRIAQILNPRPQGHTAFKILTNSLLPTGENPMHHNIQDLCAKLFGHTLFSLLHHPMWSTHSKIFTGLWNIKFSWHLKSHPCSRLSGKLSCLKLLLLLLLLLLLQYWGLNSDLLDKYSTTWATLPASHSFFKTLVKPQVLAQVCNPSYSGS
jgi:hypothetical protein